MSTYIVRFGLARLVEAESPEAAKEWARYTLASLQRHVPDTDPYRQGHVQGSAGSDHAEITAPRPDAQEGEARWTPAGFVFLDEDNSHA